MLKVAEQNISKLDHHVSKQPEESGMDGHTGHGVFVGHEKKGLQILKPGLAIQPGAIA